MLGTKVLLADNNRPHSVHVFLLTTILLLNHGSNNVNKVVNGQAIIPLLQPPEEGARNNDSALRSFLEPCEVVTIQTQCTEDEYESNEDCLPQKKDNCDRSKELFCLSGVCLPNCHPHKETYDSVEGKCFRKVGSDCKSFAKVPPQPTQSSLLISQENENGNNGESQQSSTTTVVVPACEKHAVCEKGQCKCAKNFTYNHNFSKCMLSASYADYCNETISCDRKSDIVCKENQCLCKSPETQYIHLKRKRCYILIGQVCSTGLQFWPDNSSCVRKKEGERDNNNVNGEDEAIEASFTSKQYHGDRNSTDKEYDRLRLLYEEHQSGQYDTAGQDEHFLGIWGDEEGENDFFVKCNKGYGSTRDKRFCLGLHGTRCNTLHRCNMERGLKCVDGICLCDRERGNEQIFSQQFQTCITRINSACKEDICPIGGSCKKEKCTCDKGLTATAASSPSNPPSTFSIAYSCMKSHGMFCKSNRNSSSTSNSNISSLLPQGNAPFEPPCNHEIGLECNIKEGKCLCKDLNQFYNVEQKTCQNIHGIDTKIPVIHFTPPDDREYNFNKSSGGRSGSGSFNKLAILLIFKYCLNLIIRGCSL